MINPDLLAWVQRIFHYILHGDEEAEVDEESPLEDMILVVGGFLLDLQDTPSTQELEQQLGQFYSLSECQSDRFLTDEGVELLLVHAVSEHCPQRQVSVSAIMQMESETQMQLMQIIQGYMSGASEREEAVEEEAEPADVIPVVTSASSSLMDMDEDQPSCSQCKALLEVLSTVKQDLAAQEQGRQQEVMDLRKQLAAESTHLANREDALLKKNQEIFSLENLLKDQEARARDLEKVSNQLVMATARMHSLQDDLEIVKPQAERCEALENNLMKMREKLEKLSDVDARLSTEQAQHQLTYEKMICAEQQLAALKALEPQLELYRSELAEIRISSEDQLMQLGQQSALIRQLEDENSRLSGGQQAQLKQQQSLVQELAMASEELRTSNRCQGVGEGVSELNPALMQELHRLRSDNSDLQAKIVRCSTDALAKMDKEIADVKCVNSSLQGKWTKTKDQLAAAERMVADLQLQLINERSAVMELRQRLQETAALAAEEVAERRRVFVKRNQFAERKGLASAQLVQIGLQQTERVYKQERDALQGQLDQSEEQAADLAASLTSCQHDLHTAQEELVLAGTKRKMVEEETEQRMQRIKLDHDQELSSKEQEHSQAMVLMEQSCNDRIAMEAQRAVSLSAELEEELQKRRRLDRTKRMLETENQRLKVQLGGAAEGGNQPLNGDFTLAAKELRSMQEQIDGQQQEITALRQQLQMASRASDGSSDEAGGQQVSSLHSRAVRVGVSASLKPATAGNASQSIQSFIEQTEFNDKRIEQLNREKREILSKCMEDGKEKVELGQRLAAVDKENNALRTELRKIMLEKERLERRMLKQGGAMCEDKENMVTVNQQL